MATVFSKEYALHKLRYMVNSEDYDAETKFLEMATDYHTELGT